MRKEGYLPLIEVGVLFYAASLMAAVAIGWFARAVFQFRCKHCGTKR